MNTTTVPASFQTRSRPGNLSRTRGLNAEELVMDFMAEHGGHTRSTRAYLPITWWMNSVNQQTGNERKRYPVPQVQEFLDALDPAVRYVTVSRGDDGPYEQLPQGTIVFGAGGTGDIPIPLLPPA